MPVPFNITQVETRTRSIKIQWMVSTYSKMTFYDLVLAHLHNYIKELCRDCSCIFNRSCRVLQNISQYQLLREHSKPVLVNSMPILFVCMYVYWASWQRTQCQFCLYVLMFNRPVSAHASPRNARKCSRPCLFRSLRSPQMHSPRRGYRLYTIIN